MWFCRYLIKSAMDPLKLAQGAGLAGVLAGGATPRPAPQPPKPLPAGASPEATSYGQARAAGTRQWAPQMGTKPQAQAQVNFQAQNPALNPQAISQYAAHNKGNMPGAQLPAPSYPSENKAMAASGGLGLPGWVASKFMK